MASVSHLAQYLLNRNPDKNLSRLSLYNYVRHTRTGAEPVTEDLAFAFFASCLNFEHWRKEEEALKESLVTELTSFFNQYSHDRFDPAGILNWQSVEIKDPSNALAIVGQLAKTQLEPDVQHRVLQFEGNKSLHVFLRASGELRVKSYGPVFIIKNGLLSLPPARTDLRYDKSLMLLSTESQLLEIAPHTQCLFRFLDGEWKSIVLRGYSYQRVSARADKDLTNYADLFYALKHVESRFVDMQSDPFYQETVAFLEKAVAFLRRSPEEGLGFARTALERGRLAVSRVFVDDKMLTLLVNSLEFDIYKLIKGSEAPPLKAPEA